MKLPLTFFFVIASSAALFCSTANAFDEEEEYSALFALSLEDLLDVKVSVASRFEQSIIDTPSNITVISKKQLQSWNVSPLWDLIASI
jgi:outer membrane receptor for ferrienterochelin and colicin